MSDFCYEMADSPDEIIEICKEKSKEGWDFVSFTFRDKYSNYLIIFERYCEEDC